MLDLNPLAPILSEHIPAPASWKVRTSTHKGKVSPQSLAAFQFPEGLACYLDAAIGAIGTEILR